MPTMKKDIKFAQEAANNVTVKIDEKQKKEERKARIKKNSDILGLIVLIGLATFMSITLVQQDFKNGIIWLLLGLSCGAIGSTAVRLVKKKKEEPVDYTRLTMKRNQIDFNVKQLDD